MVLLLNTIFLVGGNFRSYVFVSVSRTIQASFIGYVNTHSNFFDRTVSINQLIMTII